MQFLHQPTLYLREYTHLISQRYLTHLSLVLYNREVENHYIWYKESEGTHGIHLTLLTPIYLNYLTYGRIFSG